MSSRLASMAENFARIICLFAKKGQQQQDSNLPRRSSFKEGEEAEEQEKELESLCCFRPASSEGESMCMLCFDRDRGATTVSSGTPLMAQCKEIKIGFKMTSHQERDDLVYELNQEVINLGALQRIAGLGLPEDGGLRALAWKLLLGYLPVEQHSWEVGLKSSREKYAQIKKELLLNPTVKANKRGEELVLNKDGRGFGTFGLLRRDGVFEEDHPLSLVKASCWHQFFQDNEIIAQINRDLLRTHPDVAFFSSESTTSWKPLESMRNILLLFAKLNPAIGYVQGMNEILAPLFYVISRDPSIQKISNAEADAFSCFVLLMSDLVDHFCSQLDNSPSGILSTLAKMMDLLKINDKELWKHLRISAKINPQFYAFRWITLLFTQEFDFKSTLRVWDSILGNQLGVQEMVQRISVAMLLCVRKKLFDGDFAANLKLLQRYPEVDLEHLLLVARDLKTL